MDHLGMLVALMQTREALLCARSFGLFCFTCLLAGVCLELLMVAFLALPGAKKLFPCLFCPPFGEPLIRSLFKAWVVLLSTPKRGRLSSLLSNTQQWKFGQGVD